MNREFWELVRGKEVRKACVSRCTAAEMGSAREPTC